jgi:hypothetical protein
LNRLDAKPMGKEVLWHLEVLLISSLGGVGL